MLQPVNGRGGGTGGEPCRRGKLTSAGRSAAAQEIQDAQVGAADAVLLGEAIVEQVEIAGGAT